MSDDDNNNLLTLKQAAAFLRVSERTLRRWRDLNKVPFKQMPSGRARFDRRELAVWLDQRGRGAAIR